MLGGDVQSGTVCLLCLEHLLTDLLTTIQAVWLLARKQMMIEGLEEFHRRSIWVLRVLKQNDEVTIQLPTDHTVTCA